MPIERRKNFAGIIVRAISAADQPSPNAADLHGAFCLGYLSLSSVIANLAALADTLSINLTGFAICPAATNEPL